MVTAGATAGAATVGATIALGNRSSFPKQQHPLVGLIRGPCQHLPSLKFLVFSFQ